MTKSTKKKLQRFLVGYSRFLGTAAIIEVILLLIPLSVPRLFGYQTYDVVSGSMEPEIPVGSMIFVKEIVPEDVVEGDIIAFYSNSNVVCHRVTYNNIYERKFNTKGDANPDEDLIYMQSEMIDHRIRFLKENKIPESMVGVREEGRVMVYDNELI